MKLLVFAHSPPPLHGQSYMVELMLRVLGGDQRQRRQFDEKGKDQRDVIECFHVNARLSDGSDDIGKFRPAKILRLLAYCSQALWCRVRYGADTFYYIPAPGKRGAVYRDWIVMVLCRGFFKATILHWHASGLATWLETEASNFERVITCALLGGADLSIALASPIAEDARYLQAKKIAIVTNGIPDPCPDFETRILPRRRERYAARIVVDPDNEANPAKLYEVLYLAQCSREKGLFEALGAVGEANRRLIAANSKLRMRLTVAGDFVTEAERSEFMKSEGVAASFAHSVGFLDPQSKFDLLANSDCLCFPSYYRAEGQPVAIIEAMAFGMSIVATDWRAIPEMLPPHGKLVPPRNAAAIADALLLSAAEDFSVETREAFLNRFTSETHIAQIRSALRQIDT